jgi:hypothetical protein
MSATFFQLAFGDLYHKDIKEMQTTVSRKRKQPAEKLEVPGDLVLTERVDRAALNWLDKHRDEIMKQGNATVFAKYAEDVRHSADGQSRVVVYRKSQFGVGRLYAVGSLSLANLKRRVRATLAHKFYYDIDMSNSHPCILLKLVKDAGGSAPCLQFYVEHREEVLKEFPYDASVTKRIFLAMINGGGHHKVLAKSQVANQGISNFGENFKQEMRKVAQFIHDKHRHLHRVAKDLSGRKAHLAVMSYAMQELEMQITMAAIEFLRRENWIVGAVIHDGFLTEKRSDAVLTVDTLRQVSEYVLSQVGIFTLFEIKPFEEVYDIESSDGTG